DTGSGVPVGSQAFAAYTPLHVRGAQSATHSVAGGDGNLNHWAVETYVVPQGAGAWQGLPVLVAVAVLTFAVLLVGSLRFSASIARRLRRVGSALAAVGDGDLTTSIPPDGDDEIGDT